MELGFNVPSFMLLAIEGIVGYLLGYYTGKREERKKRITSC